MVLTKQNFFIKAGFLVAAVAVSNLQWSIALNSHREDLFYLGSLLAVVAFVPIVAVIPGVLFGVAALAMGKRTWDHFRVCILMGLYVVALWMVYFNITRLADIPRPPTAEGGGSFPWYPVYIYAFIYSLPGVDFRQTQQKIDQEKAQRQQNAQRPGVNRWLLIGRASLLVFAIIVLIFWIAADFEFALKLGGVLGGVTAVVYGLFLFLSDAIQGRLRFWKIVFPSLGRGTTRQSETIDWSAMSLALIRSKNWSGLLLLTGDWMAAERGNHECWASKGLAHEMLGDFDQAIPAYQTSLKIRHDERVGKRLDALLEDASGKMHQTRAREERERKTKGEDGRDREQRTRDTGSKSGNTDSGRSHNFAHLDHYYRILEIQPGVPINEVKAAYKRRMQQYHPDKVASLGKELRDLAEAKTKEINAAYRSIVDTRDA